jgi:hypothetical protein
VSSCICSDVGATDEVPVTPLVEEDGDSLGAEARHVLLQRDTGARVSGDASVPPERAVKTDPPTVLGAVGAESKSAEAVGAAMSVFVTAAFALVTAVVVVSPTAVRDFVVVDGTLWATAATVPVTTAAKPLTFVVAWLTAVVAAVVAAAGDCVAVVATVVAVGAAAGADGAAGAAFWGSGVEDCVTGEATVVTVETGAVETEGAGATAVAPCTEPFTEPGRSPPWATPAKTPVATTAAPATSAHASLRCVRTERATGFCAAESTALGVCPPLCFG